MKLKISVTLIVTALIAWLSFEMLKLAQIECGLCIDFKGQRVCTKALGPTEEEAIKEAHTNACAQLSSGVTEVLACNQATRQQIQCHSGLQ